MIQLPPFHLLHRLTAGKLKKEANKSERERKRKRKRERGGRG